MTVVKKKIGISIFILFSVVYAFTQNIMNKEVKNDTLHRYFKIVDIVIEDSTFLKKETSFHSLLIQNQFNFEQDSNNCFFYNIDTSYGFHAAIVESNENEIYYTLSGINIDYFGYDFSDRSFYFDYHILFDLNNDGFRLFYKKRKESNYTSLLKGRISIVSYDRNDFLFKKR